MEVQIVEKHENMVRVNTTIGFFYGIWCSPVPAELRKYIVELDSDDVLTLETIRLSNSSEPCISCLDGIIYLNGVVEEIQDGLIFLRLHKSIMMLEISPHFDFSMFFNQFVCVRLHGINLFDTGLC